jgi:hypothetical protein
MLKNLQSPQKKGDQEVKKQKPESPKTSPLCRKCVLAVMPASGLIPKRCGLDLPGPRDGKCPAYAHV